MRSDKCAPFETSIVNDWFNIFTKFQKYVKAAYETFLNFHFSSLVCSDKYLEINYLEVLTGMGKVSVENSVILKEDIGKHYSFISGIFNSHIKHNMINLSSLWDQH